MATDDRWCFAWFAAPKGGPGKDRAALVKGAKWNPGDVITVSFLDGDPQVQARVRTFAEQWTVPGLARLTLSFRSDTTDTDIRISFRYAGSWSVIGTTCHQVPDGQATMNYGWLKPTTPDDEVRRVVLHEFGHALGLIHEHQNPAGGIKWNKPKVIADLSGPPNNWDLQTIEHNMFEPYAAAETNFTATDPDSIMMYPIPVGWTLDGFTVGLNTDLSPTDQQFIHQQYP
jgi:hypothetical protein